MPLVPSYAPNGTVFYSGSENNADGSVTMTQELPIPFQRNRFCNPLGRLLGPRGQTIKWLRRETGCDIIVDSNATKLQKTDSKVTIRARDSPLKVKAKMDQAVQLVLAIINPEDPGNTAMSDYQLFHPEDPANENLSWVPSNFNSANSGPTVPANLMATASNCLTRRSTSPNLHPPSPSSSSGSQGSSASRSVLHGSSSMMGSLAASLASSSMSSGPFQPNHLSTNSALYGQPYNLNPWASLPSYNPLANPWMVMNPQPNPYYLPGGIPAAYARQSSGQGLGLRQAAQDTSGMAQPSHTRDFLRRGGL